MGSEGSRPQNYNAYKWNPAQMKHGVKSHKVGAYVPGAEAPDGKSVCLCPICYLYYPKLNATQCCQKGICTECIFATIEPDFQQAKCPFCRATPVKVIADRITTTSEDDAEFRTFDAKRKAGEMDTGIADRPIPLPPETEAIAQDISRNCHLDIQSVRELLLAGISPDEIAASAAP
jgi:hypothetical protein